MDGAHIRTLILTLFYRYFRPIIDGGFIYIAQPPLYKIKKGKEVHYAYSDDEKARIIGRSSAEVDEIELPAAEVDRSAADVDESESTSKTPKVLVQRYKGLGEMNAEELWETTMDPKRRILKQIAVEDAQEADRIFDVLMGSDVPARKSFIQSNAKLATIDI